MGKSWKNPFKEAKAAEKGKLFTKLAREVAVAAKLGGPDPDANARLKLAIQNARAASCPKDTIDRAIKKGSGQLDDGQIIEELLYEGFGPHNVGILVECQSDNRNRTVSDLRTLFRKHGGNLGENGSVAWMFERVALVSGKKANVEDPEVEAIEAGANEVETDDGVYHFYGATEDLDNIRTVLTSRGWEVTAAELSYKPKTLTELTEEQKKEVHALLEALEDNDDSHRVHATIA